MRLTRSAFPTSPWLTTESGSTTRGPLGRRRDLKLDIAIDELVEDTTVQALLPRYAGAGVCWSIPKQPGRTLVGIRVSGTRRLGHLLRQHLVNRVLVSHQRRRVRPQEHDLGVWVVPVGLLGLVVRIHGSVEIRAEVDEIGLPRMGVLED